MRFACLHTSITNIAVFEAACPEDVALTHHVDADLLKRANEGLTSAIVAETRAELARLDAGVDAVVLTCSTLRPAVQKPAFSADQILAEEVGKRGKGKSVEVFYTNPGTEHATTALFSGLNGLKSLQVRIIPEAWNAFMEGRATDYYTAIQAAAMKSEADLIVLAQASMAPAIAPDDRVMSCPSVGLKRVRDIVSARQSSLSA